MFIPGKMGVGYVETPQNEGVCLYEVYVVFSPIPVKILKGPFGVCYALCPWQGGDQGSLPMLVLHECNQVPAMSVYPENAWQITPLPVTRSS